MSEVEEYGKVSASILAELLDFMEIEAEIEVNNSVNVADGDGSEEESLVLNILGEDLGLLIGRKGQTLSSLQYVTRLIASQRTGLNLPMVLDVNGYKQRRFDSLKALARHVADQVLVSKRSIALEPMPAYERRIVHMALADDKRVTTQSTGFGEARKIVIALAK